MKESIVITGVGAVTALGRNLEATRAALDRGESGLAPVPGDGLLPGEEASLAARIATFTTEPELPRARARRLDRGSQYAFVATRQCMASGGYDMAGREERTGILMGTGSAGAGPLVELERQMAFESPEAASPFNFPYTVSNAPASQTAIELGIKGPNVTLIQKDPIVAGALFYARLLLWDGRADAIFVGAVDEWNLTYHRAYERARITGTPTRPGFSLGEGAAVTLVETAGSARRRGARVLAEVSGIGFLTVAVSPHKRRARPEDLAAVMRKALAEAGCGPLDIGLIHLSANGFTPLDDAESEAIRAVFSQRPVAHVRVKRQLGENPAIVAVQIALAAASLGDRSPSGAVLLNAFGAGGNFMSLVLK